MNTGIFLTDEAATLAAGATLARISSGKGLFTLQGNLGSGKTSFSRGVIQALGHAGAVKSPTYTLVEPYDLPSGRVLHYDLYRLNDPEELHFLGVRDFLDADVLTLVEWPERGQNWLPTPELALSLSVEGAGRRLRWLAGTERGKDLSLQLERHLAG